MTQFNLKWDAIIEDLTHESHKIEDDLQQQHNAEKQRFEEEMEKQVLPPVKFSADLLDKKFKLEQLIKNKKYGLAKVMKEKTELLEEKERQNWETRFFSQKEKQREILSKKQRNEYEALKTRLEKSINSKLKLRMNDYDKLLQRVQNLQNQLMAKQSLTFAKISSTNSKILAKYAMQDSDIMKVLEGQIKRILSEKCKRRQFQGK